MAFHLEGFLFLSHTHGITLCRLLHGNRKHKLQHSHWSVGRREASAWTPKENKAERKAGGAEGNSIYCHVYLEEGPGPGNGGFFQ